MTGSDFVRALSALYGERLRTALALLGIIMGTSSLVLLAALLAGGQDALVAAQQDANESDVVVVRASDPPPAQARRTRRELSRRDAGQLAASRALDGAWIGTEQTRTRWAHHGAKSKRVTVMSVAPEARSVYRLELSQGRFLDRVDLERRGHTCVIGHEVWRELFAGQRALGRSLAIDGDVWLVVGVLEDKPILGSTDSTDIWNRKVLIAETSFDATYNPAHHVQKVLLRPRSGEAESASLSASASTLTNLRRLVRESLSRLHHGVLNFDVEPRQDGGQEELILTILRVLLFGATLISLFVSGINVMNVMLVSVRERTVEIGIRRALGAPPRLILRQFLSEALVLTGLGGLLGIGLGVGLAYLATLILRRALGAWALHLEPWAILLGFGSSLLVGLVFGLYPALRAARLDVVEALRNE
jgi:putative ABC transport system permease protein